MTNAWSPHRVGPRRRVENRPDYKLGRRTHYRYELVCGHLVERGQPRREHCYCENCAEGSR
jgi:hypothetical protein